MEGRRALQTVVVTISPARFGVQEAYAASRKMCGAWERDGGHGTYHQSRLTVISSTIDNSEKGVLWQDDGGELFESSRGFWRVAGDVKYRTASVTEVVTARSECRERPITTFQ